jgi:hypothetical protein
MYFKSRRAMFRKSVKSTTGLILWTVILNLLVCMIVLPGCGPIQGHLDNKDTSFHVDVPTGWKTKADPELALIAVNPLEGPSDQFSEVMMVAVEVMPINVSLKKYMVAFKRDLLAEYTDARIVEEGPTYLNKKAGQYFIFEFMYDRMIAKGVSYTVMERNKAYSLVFLSSRSEFDRHSVLFDRLKDTFRIDKQW